MRNSYAVNAVLRHYPKLDPALVAGRLSYCTFVSLNYRYLYFEVPKAACSALKLLLLQIENCPVPEFEAAGAETRGCVRRDTMIHDRKRLAIKSLMDFDDEKQREILESPEFLRLLVVRNPYSRLVSTWRNKILVCEPGFEHIYEHVKGHSPSVDEKELISFEEFVDYIGDHENLDLCNPHWRRQAVHAFFPSLNFNFIGKTEKLGAVLDRIRQHIGWNALPKLSSKNISGSPCDPRITQPIAEKIQSLYREDFASFDYDPQTWPKFEPGNSVPADVFHDEIIERNLVIAALYDEIRQLKSRSGHSEIVSLSRVRDKLLRKLRKQ